jgi:exopolysaccharide biosynthesis polyprenyl glycosylphosphotransferase
MNAPESIVPNLYTENLVVAPSERQARSRGRFRRVMTLVEVLADFLTSVVSICAAYYLYFSLNIGSHIQYPVKEVIVFGCVVGLLIVLLLERDGAYKGGGSLLQIRETERAIRIPAQALLVFLPITLLLNRSISRVAVLTALVMVPLFLVVQKHIFFSVVRALHAKGYGLERVVIYGAGYTGRRVMSALLHSPKLGLRPVAMVDDNRELAGSYVFELGYRRSSSVAVKRGPITPNLLKACRCNMLVVAIPSLIPEKLSAISRVAKRAGVSVAFLPGLAVQEHHWMESIDIDGLLLTTLSDPVDPWFYTITKRVVDVTLSVLLLLVLGPLLLLIALLIRLDSAGSAIFVQQRVGKNGRLFNMYKFRSMQVDAPKYGFSPTESLDPRITRIGRFLRRISLDEIPQLLNVLLGDMSLVGPRPEMPFIVETYNARQRQRLQVLPGITGLWQLSADRAFQIHENIQYDLYYIRNRSFFMDMAILVHTMFFAMQGV